MPLGVNEVGVYVLTFRNRLRHAKCVVLQNMCGASEMQLASGAGGVRPLWQHNEEAKLYSG